MKKRLLKGVLACTVAFSCFVSVFAEYAENGGNATYDGKSYVKTEAFMEDFESYKSVQDLKDAKWNMTEGCVALAGRGDGGTAVTLGHNSDDPTKDTEFHKDANVSCAGAPVLISEDICFSDNTSRRKIMLLMHWEPTARYEVNGIVAHENGYFCLDIDGEQKLMPYEAGRWYNIKAVVDAAAHTIEYIIDGKNVSGKQDIPSGFSQVTRFTPIKQGGTTGVGTATVDNCNVYSLRESLVIEDGMIIRKGNAYSVNEILADSFDGYTGGIPDKWASGTPAAGLNAVTIDEAHGPSVKLSKDTEDTELYRVDSISANSGNNGVYLFSAEYKFGDANGQRWLMILPDADKILITQNGQFKIKDTSVNLMPFTADKWYTVSALVDVQAQRYEYYIDGKLVMEGGFTKEITNVQRITPSRERGAGCWHAVDNFRFVKLNAHPTNMQLAYNGVKFDGLTMDSDNFDAYTGEKTAPAGWFASTADNAYASAASVDSLHGSSVQLTKVTADAELYKNLSSGLFWDRDALYMVSADYMFKNTNSQRPLMIVQQNADNNQTMGAVEKVENYVFMAQNNGWFSASNGSTRYAQYEKNKWYRVQTVIDVANQKYMVLVNGEVMVPATDFPSYFCNINRITLAKQRGAGDVTIDNYGLYKMKRSIDNELADITLDTLCQDGFGITERTTQTKPDNTVEYVEKDGGYAMKLGNADNLYAYSELPASDKNYSKYIFTQNIKFSDTTQSRYLFAMKFSNGTESKEALTIKTNSDKIKDAATDKELMAYQKDTWYKVQMIADVVNCRYSAYVNGALIGEGSYANPVKDSKLTSVAYISSWGAAHNDVYLDDLAVQTADAYEVIRNVGIYFDGTLLKNVSDLIDGDMVTAEASFDVGNSMVIIALYSADGRLLQAAEGGMTMPNVFDDCSMKAFVLDKATLAPQCDAYQVEY